MLKHLTAAAVTALAVMPILASPSQAVPGQNGDYPGQSAHEWCQVHGGQDIPQPPGSSITACCTATACVICDTDWENCAIDPAYSQRPIGRPLFESNGPGTMAPADQSSAGTMPGTMILTAPAFRVIN